MSSKSKFYLIFQGQRYSSDTSGYHSSDAMWHCRWVVRSRSTFQYVVRCSPNDTAQLPGVLEPSADYLTTCVDCSALQCLFYAIESVAESAVVVFGMNQDGQVAAILNWEVIFETTMVGVQWHAICQTALIAWLFFCRTRTPVSNRDTNMCVYVRTQLSYLFSI
jgi:hypothetical protein